jgi:translation initiation factor IF-2
VALRLQNPHKVVRIAPEPQQRQPRGDRPDRGPGGPRGGPGGGRPSAAGDASSRPRRSPVGGDSNNSNDTPDTGGDRGPRRNIAGKAKKKKGPEGQEPKRRNTSLRIGTGKKGRRAEVMGRRGSLKKRDRRADKEDRMERAMERRMVFLPDTPMSVQDLAQLLDEKPVALIKFLMTDLGIMAGMTQTLDPATCIAVVEGLGRTVGGADDEDDDDDDEDDDEDTALSSGLAFDEDPLETLRPRAPVVTIMGHVDHGKTSLLDAIRNTRVVAGEAGGITQHIAAYQIEYESNSITFIDTPGHAAFTDMRQRGANITDIVILVVAADDGVKQQTADSIVCARQAGVPIVVAINKCDLATADVAKVKAELTGYDVLTEDLGGDVQFAEISAKEGTNLDDLLSKIMLQAEIQDLKANPDRFAQGAVIEARVMKGLGTVATTLIQRGTIRVGDAFVAGETSGRVRALIGADGKTRYKEAGPSTPISVVGFDGVPSAGDILVVAEDETKARELALNRQRIARETASTSYQSGLMASVIAQFGGPQKERREMCVVVKADVQGSAEALKVALSDLVLENEEAIVTVKVLVSEAGEVTKSDVAIASVTPDTTIIAFNCGANFAATEDARTMSIPVEYFNIVYDAIDSVESRMQEVLSPTPDGEYTGAATVQEVFNIGGTGNIAGSKCTDGFLKKGANVRILRGDKILMESKIKTLRNFKSEVDSIESGDECGIGLIDFEDFEPGDVIDCYVEKKK